MTNQSDELEIEGKRLLTYSEFKAVRKHFTLSDQNFKVQHNYYFDTDDFRLKARNAALRIRERNESQTLTIKTRTEDGIVEKHQRLAADEWTTEEQNLANISEGFVTKHLTNSLQLSLDSLIYLGILSTWRAEWAYDEGTLALDISNYLGQRDYELEFEGRSFGHVNNILDILASRIGIYTYLEEPPPKIERFFRKKAAH